MPYLQQILTTTMRQVKSMTKGDNNSQSIPQMTKLRQGWHLFLSCSFLIFFSEVNSSTVKDI